VLRDQFGCVRGPKRPVDLRSVLVHHASKERPRTVDVRLVAPARGGSTVCRGGIEAVEVGERQNDVVVGELIRRAFSAAARAGDRNDADSLLVLGPRQNPIDDGVLHERKLYMRLTRHTRSFGPPGYRSR
jgi:hypothetical protein